MSEVGFLIFRGSAFHCSLHGNEIVLSRDNFQNEGYAMKSCSNGTISAYVSAIEDGCIVSQLIVNVTSELNGLSVECIHYRNTEAVIGSLTLQVTTGINDNTIHIQSVALLISLEMGSFTMDL